MEQQFQKYENIISQKLFQNYIFILLDLLFNKFGWQFYLFWNLNFIFDFLLLRIGFSVWRKKHFVFQISFNCNSMKPNWQGWIQYSPIKQKIYCASFIGKNLTIIPNNEQAVFTFFYCFCIYFVFCNIPCAICYVLGCYWHLLSSVLASSIRGTGNGCR